MHLAIALLLSAGIGLSLGLIGGGGSIVTVPVLVYVLGVDPHEAIAMSLAVVGATSLVATALHARAGSVDFRTGALFGVFGVAGALVGSALTYLVPPAVLMLSFAVLMLVTATAMLAGRERSEDGPHPARSTPVAAAAGFTVGALTGFLGVGGGFLIVPALTLVGGLRMKAAVGTSLFVIFVNCVAGLAGHLRHGAFDLGTAALVTALAVAGTLAGAALSHRTSPGRLRTGFAVFVIFVAAFLAVKNLPGVL